MSPDADSSPSDESLSETETEAKTDMKTVADGGKDVDDSVSSRTTDTATDTTVADPDTPGGPEGGAGGRAHSLSGLVTGTRLRVPALPRQLPLSGRNRRVFVSLTRHRAAVVGGTVMLAIVVIAVFAPVIAPYDPTRQFVGQPLSSPSLAHPLGTDMFGRDVLSRIIFGARTSIILAVFAVGISSVVGTFLGAFAGFYGGWFDESMMRAMDIIFAFPSLILALLLMATFGPSMWNAALAISVVFTPQFARVIRSNALVLREEEFVKAATTSGGSKPYILVKHIIPNGISEIVVQASINIASAILIAAGLNFLGVGIQPPRPSWGYMLANGRTYLLQAFWISTFPGVAIMITVLAANLFGDGLRDALDPRNTERVR
jgi:peptide/nickel transport system permease protein